MTSNQPRQVAAYESGDRSPHSKHHHGIDVPLFSLHSQHSCGIGEYPDLIPLIQWCKSVGMDIIQLLPLNDTGPDTSPYNALSAFALNPWHIGLTVLGGVQQDALLMSMIRELQKLNSTPRVDYPKVRAGKEAFFRRYFQLMYPKISATEGYQNFLKQHSWLPGYALFKALKIEKNWQAWREWPPELQPSEENRKRLLESHRNEVNYHHFLQYLCFQQFKKVHEAAQAASVFIKGDIPITISPEAADTWLDPQLFILDLGAGAPPDAYASEGQAWGFPLYNWEAVAQDDYLWWKQRLAVASELYDIYRIDHIVGFFRIWAIPRGKKAIEGAFVPADHTKWIPQGRAILETLLKSCPMLPIGEDLGTVPGEVRQCLAELGICGTKVMRWSRRWEQDGSYIPVKEYPVDSMTTVSTHDSEPLGLWWQNQREEAELYARFKGWGYSPRLLPEQRKEILRDSHHSSSLFHINLLPEHLALFPELVAPNLNDERINVPGTITERNWSYRLRPSLEHLLSHHALKESVQRLLRPRENGIH